MAEGKIQGLAFRYTIVLPLISEQTGEEVFSLENDVPTIIKLLGKRFGGCTILPVSRGTWLPSEGRRVEADRSIHLYVYARQQDGIVDWFFQYLKYRLMRFGKQEEIVVEKAEVYLLSSRAR